ncbi:MAG TPA: hypothetical protein VEY13_01485 [Rubrobacteraceae bacterium]|nr:hypothetical protein [Rubrobacteraceae bacterium]
MPSEKLVRCDCCLRVAEEHDLYEAGTGEDGQDRICERCQALFLAAKLLSEKDDADEVEIISTLALAAHSGWSVPPDYAHRYARFEAKGVVKGVPVLRLKSVVMDVVRYPDSSLARHVQIEFFSKFARPEHVAEHYQEILASEGLPVRQSSSGSIRWEHRAETLVVDVGPREEIALSRLEHFAAYPQVCRFSFPHPRIVEHICRALVGAPRRPGTKGDEMFAAGLGDYGRPRPKEARTLIPACIAWYIGEYEQTKDNVPPAKVRRPRIARMLNRYLPKSLNESGIVDDPYSSSDPVWEDAQEVGCRFDRIRLFLQADERDFFRRLLSKAPI